MAAGAPAPGGLFRAKEVAEWPSEREMGFLSLD